MPLNLNRGVGLVNELFFVRFQSLQTITVTPMPIKTALILLIQLLVANSLISLS